MAGGVDGGGVGVGDGVHTPEVVMTKLGGGVEAGETAKMLGGGVEPGETVSMLSILGVTTMCSGVVARTGGVEGMKTSLLMAMDGAGKGLGCFSGVPDDNAGGAVAVVAEALGGGGGRLLVGVDGAVVLFCAVIAALARAKYVFSCEDDEGTLF